MFSANREVIPDNLSKKTLFSLLEEIGLKDEHLVALDENLRAHGHFTINSIGSTIIIGSNTVSVMLETNKGQGSFQFNKINRLKSIDVVFIPTSRDGGSGSLQQIMRIDISESESDEVVADPPATDADTTGSTNDDQAGPN